MYNGDSGAIRYALKKAGIWSQVGAWIYSDTYPKTKNRRVKILGGAVSAWNSANKGQRLNFYRFLNPSVRARLRRIEVAVPGTNYFGWTGGLRFHLSPKV